MENEKRKEKKKKKKAISSEPARKSSFEEKSQEEEHSEEEEEDSEEDLEEEEEEDSSEPEDYELDSDYVLEERKDKDEGVTEPLSEGQPDGETSMALQLNLQWILDEIKELDQASIGNFSKGNKLFVDLSMSLNAIRTENPDFLSMLSQMRELITKDDMKTVFRQLRGISEFIIHVHKEYGVKLNPNTSKAKDSLLLETMETAVRKYLHIFLIS